MLQERVVCFWNCKVWGQNMTRQMKQAEFPSQAGREVWVLPESGASEASAEVLTLSLGDAILGK